MRRQYNFSKGVPNPYIKRKSSKKIYRMKYMNPGPEMDELVLKKLGEYKPMGWFTPSMHRPHADLVMDVITPWVGRWETSDGYFIIKYAEWAGHNDEKNDCRPNWKWYSDSEREDVDELPWSCHIHLGLIGGDAYKAGCPKHWKHGQRFCARGRTMAHAICLAFLKSMQGAKKPIKPFNLEIAREHMKATVNAKLNVRRLA